MTESTNLSLARSPSASAKPNHWLTLKDASEFLGVHYTTLRIWADQGEIAVFRTPGGHRRFSLADLRRFLEERAQQPIEQNAVVLIENAVDRAREEIQKHPQELTGWRYPLPESREDNRRRRGRQLFASAIAYVLKPAQREKTLQEARVLGREYGVEAAASGVSLVETGRAVQFFRRQLMQTIQSQEKNASLDADDLQIRALIDHFLDEVLYAVLDGYDISAANTSASSPPSV